MEKSQEQLVCKLYESIYGLMQTSCLWNRRFGLAIKALDFDQNEDDPCVYKKI